jgi:hypothetical protein
MPLDLRLAIAVLLAIYGGILVVHGLVERLTVLGVNVDLWWGAAMLASAVTLFAFVNMRRTR